MGRARCCASCFSVSSSASFSSLGLLAFISPASAQSEPFVGQLMATAATFCPRGWAQADGQLLAISQNTALFSLLGTTYGGNGQTNFALPDLRGRAPIHAGQGPGLSNYPQGQASRARKLHVDHQPVAPSYSFGAGDERNCRQGRACGSLSRRRRRQRRHVSRRSAKQADGQRHDHAHRGRRGSEPSRSLFDGSLVRRHAGSVPVAQLTSRVSASRSLASVREHRSCGSDPSRRPFGRQAAAKSRIAAATPSGFSCRIQ